MDEGLVSRLGASAPGSGRRISDAVYRELVDEMNEGLCISSPDLTFQIANSALEQIFGVQPLSLVGRNLKEFLAPEDLEGVAAQREARSGGVTGSYRLRITRPDGQPRMLEVRAKPQVDSTGAYCGSIALVKDITDRLAAERELELSRFQYKALFDQLSDVALYETGGERQLYSASLPHMLGLSEEEYKRQAGKFDELIHPEDIAACRAATAAWRAAGGRGVLSLEFRARRSDGSWVWLKDRMVSIEQAGIEAYSAGIMVDVTERALAEEALAASRRKLEMLVEQSPSAIIALDRELRIIEWNLAAELTFGFTADEAVGQPAAMIIPPSDREAAQAALQQILREGNRNKNVNRNLCKDGSTILCEWFNAALVGEGNEVTGIISSCQDITAQQAAAQAAEQARLQEAELRTIERTTATYAHEVNNPLTGIVANTQMLLEQEETGSERWLMLHETLTAAQKIGAVIRSMQAISKPNYRDYRGRDILDLSEPKA